MNTLSYVQCHFVKGKINHRLRFGVPINLIRLDKYRQIAVFKREQTVGYIRWRANEYGTQDWRLYIFETSGAGLKTAIPGVSPAIKLCCIINGPKAMKQALKALDRIETSCFGCLESLPPSYWLTFKSRINPRSTSLLLPQKFINLESNHAV